MVLKFFIFLKKKTSQSNLVNKSQTKYKLKWMEH
jgi:hypothetical protein